MCLDALYTHEGSDVRQVGRRRIDLQWIERLHDCSVGNDTGLSYIIQACTIMLYDYMSSFYQGKLVRQLKGHGHWVNTLALSSEHALRTGPFDHTGVAPADAAEGKAKALERFKTLTGGKPERLISGSDDFTMFMWEPSVCELSVLYNAKSDLIGKL